METASAHTGCGQRQPKGSSRERPQTTNSCPDPGSHVADRDARPPDIRRRRYRRCIGLRAAPAAALDADGRNGSIYINVTGQGTNITRIYTETDPQSVGLCTRGYVWVDNDVLAVTDWQCSDMGVATYFDFTVDNFETTFYSGQQICATWDNFVGRPCITVDG